MSAVSHPSSFKNMVFKKLTLALFFILPVRLANVFISLSIISLIFDIRNSTITKNANTVDKIGKMLRIQLDENILLLPEQTCRWYWRDDLLSQEIVTEAGLKTMTEVMRDNNLFIANIDTVMTKLLQNLPKSLSVKLKLSAARNRLSIKHNVTSVFLYA